MRYECYRDERRHHPTVPLAKPWYWLGLSLLRKVLRMIIHIVGYIPCLERLVTLQDTIMN